LRRGAVLKELGARLRILREGIGLSQVKIGKLVGASQVSINRYESGKGFPPAKTIMWYADYFDVSLDYLFGRTDNPQGKLYDFKPKIEDNEDMRLFIDMCFDPNSPMSGKLKDTLLEMMKGEK
jgi:transcriptional regulator with XRE-family HTH domain